MVHSNHLEPVTHHLGFQPNKVRWLPPLGSGNGISDQTTNLLSANRMLVAGCWNDDQQINALALIDLSMRCSATGSVVHESVSVLNALEHRGEVRDLAAFDCSTTGRVVVVAGSSLGGLARLQLNIPRTPDATLESCQLERYEPLWVSGLHTDAVLSVDLSPDEGTVLTAGADGRIVTAPIGATGGKAGAGSGSGSSVGGASVFHDAGGARGFIQARWSSESSFVTGGTSGGLDTWDLRAGGKRAVGRTAAELGHTGCKPLDDKFGAQRTIRSLAVNLPRPHLCATGSSQGVVCLWDLRFACGPVAQGRPSEAWPAVYSLGPEAWPGPGDVLEVRFDPAQGPEGMRTDGAARVLFCTEGGYVGACSLQGSSLLDPSALYEEFGPGGGDGASPDGPAAGRRGAAGGVGRAPGRAQRLFARDFPAGAGPVTGLDFDPHTGRDLAIVSGRECLAHVRRGVGHSFEGPFI